ncbi:ABC transporter ATP-binding protein [Vagococcus entomophilus]|uniref:Putative hemin import ATP-binding protein HrtA n=1 Tax=Vagococcus entomophilus TaxID=1160095 RepID=A0A430AJD4_9ENTE|nr:ABC transporter ATP-binding protein [Vagococcus entomophilus]RSU08226.1 hemin ABC transporter ATP-binding protein [Vagococcus entomophilus]
MTNVLNIRNISKVYGKGHTEVQALKQGDFSMKQGEFVALIGPSGSGKSTFLSLVAGLEQPTTGHVEIGSTDLAKIKEKERVRLRFQQIGFILQNANLVPFLKVKDQLHLIEKIDATKKNPNKKEELIQSLEIAHLLESYPRDLSGGEKQRVAIACSLYHDPKIILADEPTASLDTDRAFEVVNILAKEAKTQNKAILMVTHDERLLKFCDRVVKIEDGTLKNSN